MEKRILEGLEDQILYSYKDKSFFSCHEGLVENIQKDIAKWGNEVDAKLLSNNSFENEELFVEKIQHMDYKSIESNFSIIKNDYKEIADDAYINFNFLEKQLNLISKLENEKVILKDVAVKRKKAVARSLVSHMVQNLEHRKNIWKIQLIDSLRKEFLKHIKEQIEKFKKLESLVGLFSTKTGFLWDLSKGCFRESGFEILNEYADLLENDKGLQELAALLGRQNKARIEYEKELRASIEVRTEYHPQPAYKGQVVGIRASDDISSTLPCELALLKNTATRKLFEYKFVQKQLLSFRYQNMVAESISEEKQEEVLRVKEIKEQKGPVIICVDTSGSMNGSPERIAKTITFALARIALEEKRKCYLISFSTEIQTLDLSNFSKKNNNSMDMLISFLRMSFNGGTDVDPALKEALRMLKEKDYKNADVLVVSDFIMGFIENQIQKSMMEEQKKKTRFYSLVIGSSGNEEIINCFDYNWSYDIYDSNADKKLIRQVETLKKKREEEENESQN